LVPETTSDSPLRISIMPSVAMKGGTFILAMTKPEMSPLASPVRMAAARPSGSGRPI
jgi:hypothetical protein